MNSSVTVSDDRIDAKMLLVFRFLSKCLTSLLFFTLLSALLLSPNVFGGPDKQSRRIVIRNNVLADSGFGVYVGMRDDEIFIENNVLEENAEAIRLTGVKNKNHIRYNQVRNNVVGITIRDKYSGSSGYETYPVNPKDILISNNEFSNNENGNILNMLNPESETSGGESGNTSTSQAEKTVEKEKQGDSSEAESKGEKTNNSDGEEVSKENTNHNLSARKNEEDLPEGTNQKPQNETTKPSDETEEDQSTVNHKPDDSPVLEDEERDNSGTSISPENESVPEQTPQTPEEDIPPANGGNSSEDYTGLIGGVSVIGLVIVLLVFGN